MTFLWIIFSHVVLLISVLAWKNKNRQEEGVSVIREHGEDAWDMLFRVQSLLTKNPVTSGSTFSIATMSGAMKAWEFFGSAAISFQCLTSERLLFQNACGNSIHVGHWRLFWGPSAPDQGKNKSDHFPFAEKAEFPDSMIVYHTLKMRAKLHIWCCFQRIHSRRIKQGVCWPRGRQNKFRHMPPECISIPFFIQSFSSNMNWCIPMLSLFILYVLRLIFCKMFNAIYSWF